MGEKPARFHRIDEPARRAPPPRRKSCGGGQPIKGVVDLDRVEALRVVLQPTALRQIGRIKITVPVFVLPTRAPHANGWGNLLMHLRLQSLQVRVESSRFRVPRGNSYYRRTGNITSAGAPSARRLSLRTDRSINVFARKWSRRALWIGAASCLVLLLVGGVLLRSRATEQVAQVPFSDLLRHLDRGAVGEVVVSGDTLDFKLTSGQAFRTVAPANYVTTNAAFVPDLAKKNIRIDVRSAAEPAAYSYGALVLGL